MRDEIFNGIVVPYMSYARWDACLLTHSAAYNNYKESVGVSARAVLCSQ